MRRIALVLAVAMFALGIVVVPRLARADCDEATVYQHAAYAALKAAEAAPAENLTELKRKLRLLDNALDAAQRADHFPDSCASFGQVAEQIALAAWGGVVLADAQPALLRVIPQPECRAYLKLESLKLVADGLDAIYDTGRLWEPRSDESSDIKQHLGEYASIVAAKLGMRPPVPDASQAEFKAYVQTEKTKGATYKATMTSDCAKSSGAIPNAVIIMLFGGANS